MQSTHYFHIEHSRKVQNNVMYNLDPCVGHRKVITINQEEEGDCCTWDKKF